MLIGALFMVLTPTWLVADEWVTASKTGERSAAEFRFTVSGQDYHVTADGSLATSTGHGSKLPVSKGNFIDRLYALSTGVQIAIAYQSQNDETVVAHLVGLSLPSLATRWEAKVNELNLGVPAFAGGYAYVTASGFVGKLDLSRGGWAWRQQDLNKRYNRFEWFAQPVVGRGLVTLSEAHPEAFGHDTRVNLVLDAETGAILEPK